jgi:hypothetical protein
LVKGSGRKRSWRNGKKQVGVEVEVEGEEANWQEIGSTFFAGDRGVVA